MAGTPPLLTLRTGGCCGISLRGPGSGQRVRKTVEVGGLKAAFAKQAHFFLIRSVFPIDAFPHWLHNLFHFLNFYLLGHLISVAWGDADGGDEERSNSPCPLDTPKWGRWTLPCFALSPGSTGTEGAACLLYLGPQAQPSAHLHE